MDDVFVHTTYCDDIRQEINGKQSFIGVYNSDLLALEFPLNLPKLCANITVRFPITTTTEHLLIKVTTNERTLFEFPLPEGELQRMSKSLRESKDDSRYLTVGLGLQLTPLQIEQPTTIHTYAYVDGVEIKGPGLRVRTPRDEERSALQIPQAIA